MGKKEGKVIGMLVRLLKQLIKKPTYKIMGDDPDQSADEYCIGCDMIMDRLGNIDHSKSCPILKAKNFLGVK